MADLQNYDMEHPAEMDYPEHEKTYDLFLMLTKWGLVATIAVVLGMTVGLMAGGGFIGGIGTFIVVLAAVYFLT